MTTQNKRFSTEMSSLLFNFIFNVLINFEVTVYFQACIVSNFHCAQLLNPRNIGRYSERDAFFSADTKISS